jgi:hypothetical protein
MGLGKIQANFEKFLIDGKQGARTSLPANKKPVVKKIVERDRDSP